MGSEDPDRPPSNVCKHSQNRCENLLQIVEQFQKSSIANVEQFIHSVSHVTHYIKSVLRFISGDLILHIF